ncbi:hypothetical protein T439DRAFT_187056 [Meredithblackwellia eburnea MCA 4105]
MSATGSLIQHGTVALFGIAERSFLAFAVLAFTALCFIDAPFGRFVPKRFSINGNVGWLLMELVSPLGFLSALASPLTSTPLSSKDLPTFARLKGVFFALPLARKILVVCFLVHYFNRAVVSTLRNPGRARMHAAVPLAAAFFNSLNGGLQGFNMAGGISPSSKFNTEWGLATKSSSLPIYVFGIVLFLSGFAANIACDEVLYDLKRTRSKTSRLVSPREKYGIPKGFLYSYPFGGVSHPSYTAEWLEWTGFVLAASALAPSAFPLQALEAATRAGGGFWITIFPPPAAAVLKNVPKALWPLKGWALQPPALFLWNEIAVMAPRAVSGHRWYKRTFGAEWPKKDCRSRRVLT